jgi:hypothetical protein
MQMRFSSVVSIKTYPRDHVTLLLFNATIYQPHYSIFICVEERLEIELRLSFIQLVQFKHCQAICSQSQVGNSDPESSI